MGMSGVPLPCDLRRFIAWMTVSEKHMINSHVATNDFYYRNATQCVINSTIGIILSPRLTFNIILNFPDYRTFEQTAKDSCT
jgi:hypothetical protein